MKIISMDTSNEEIVKYWKTFLTLEMEGTEQYVKAFQQFKAIINTIFSLGEVYTTDEDWQAIEIMLQTNFPGIDMDTLQLTIQSKKLHSPYGGLEDKQ